MNSELEKLALKAELKNTCLQQLQRRMNTASQAIEEARQSANSQEKSSVGDKYETARAMAQIDQEMNIRQLAQAQEEYQFLEQIAVNTINAQVIPGSVVRLESAWVFAATGLPPVKLGGIEINPVSCKSPLFQQLKFKQAGSEISFGGRTQKILSVF